MLFNILWEAFEKLHAHKVICQVLAFNAAAIHLYEKFGMQQQGYFKDYLKRDKERIDCISYAIFEQEWQKLRDDLYKRSRSH
ncbi:MAG: GNAT family N-acetyltransferase [Bacteroidales bacterium]|nr:GNAT family N-acetyltransferase [Bacteroidales bacterium]